MVLVVEYFLEFEKQHFEEPQDLEMASFQEKVPFLSNEKRLIIVYITIKLIPGKGGIGKGGNIIPLGSIIGIGICIGIPLGSIGKGIPGNPDILGRIAAGIPG
jgi:hypothetical protein